MVGVCIRRGLTLAFWYVPHALPHSPFASAAELGNSALYVVGFVWRYTNDLIARVKATAR